MPHRTPLANNHRGQPRPLEPFLSSRVRERKKKEKEPNARQPSTTATQRSSRYLYTFLFATSTSFPDAIREICMPHALLQMLKLELAKLSAYPSFIADRYIDNSILQLANTLYSISRYFGSFLFFSLLVFLFYEKRIN